MELFREFHSSRKTGSVSETVQKALVSACFLFMSSNACAALEKSVNKMEL